MKASHRRALARALARVRCPSCNRLCLAFAGARPPSASCGRCGWWGPATATYTARPTRAGHRIEASDLTLETPRP